MPVGTKPIEPERIGKPYTPQVDPDEGRPPDLAQIIWQVNEMFTQLYEILDRVEKRVYDLENPLS